MSIKAIDDATTCEQYVVAKLKSAEATIKSMTETVMELNCKIEKLEVERDGEIAKFIRETGRNKIVRDARSWRSYDLVIQDDKVKTFWDWANGYVDKYSIPEFMTKDEFIREFEPELSDIYADLVADAKGEDE